MKKFKNLMKRGLATFLSLTLVVSLMSITAFAKETDDAENDSNVTYEVEEITHNGDPVEGETFDAMKASLEDALNGGSQEDADDAAPAEGEGGENKDVNGEEGQAPENKDGEDEDGDKDKVPEGGDKEPEEASQSIKLPVNVWVELQNHGNDNLTKGDETMPEIEVTYSYELNGETVTGSYVCSEGSWVFDEGAKQWKFSYELELPEGVTSVKFKQSGYDIEGYVIGSKGNQVDDVEHEFTFGTGLASMNIRDKYCLKAHADVSVEIGGVKDENGETKEITKDEDGKLIVDYKPGDVIEYKVKVTNDGVDAAPVMLLTVTLPEGMEFYGPASITGTSNNFKGAYDYNKTPEEQGVENGDYGGFVYLNCVLDVAWTDYGGWSWNPGTKGETKVLGGTYILQIGSGYGTDPLGELDSSVTVTLLARVIKEIESGDLELKAEGTTILGVKDDATVVVYAPTPEQPPVIVITPNPTPTPTPEPEEPVDIEDPETPLGEEPDLDPEEPAEPVEIEDPETPLGELPEIIDIDDPEVPLGDVPQTGDISFMWYGAVIVSVMGLLGLSLLERKKRQEG